MILEGTDVERQRALSVSEIQEISTIRKRLEERLKESFWFIPGLLTLCAIALAVIMQIVDHRLQVHPDPENWWLGSADGGSAIAATVSTSMLTFLGVVFSITLVAVQLASTQFSPRVVRTFARSSVTKIALGTFMATFTYALLVQYFLQKPSSSSSQLVPVASVVVSLLLVGASLIVFIAFVSALIRLIRVAFMLSAIAQETRDAIDHYYLPADAYQMVDKVVLDEPDAIISYGRPPGWAFLAPHSAQGVLQGVDIPGLVHLAREHGCILRLMPRIGEYVAAGEPIIAVYGPRIPPRARVLRNFDVGRERTLYQDPAYGFRQLVDVGAQALSPAVNAPTTAIQVIDRVASLLLSIVSRPWPSGIYLDSTGTVRLLIPVVPWSTLVDLAFTEIRTYGVAAPQVTRRLAAALDDLVCAASDDRKPPLQRQLALLCRAVDRSAIAPEDREAVLHGDRLGLG